METLMKMKWKIGSVEIENPFILAPMAGVTDCLLYTSPSPRDS